MLSDGEDDLVCDFAQFYHVLDWRGLPLRLVATLAFGLPDESRVKRRGSKILAGTNTILLAKITDLLQTWVWWHTQDGSNGFNKPASILEAFIDNSDSRPVSFETGAEFDAYYEEMSRRIREGGDG